MRGLFKLVEMPSLSRLVTAREMTVADARVYAIQGDALSPQEVLMLFTDLTQQEAGRIHEEDIERVLSAALDVNTEFFGQAEAAVCNNGADGRKVAANLCRAAARMAMAGHPNVWDYPWGVFKTAVDVASEKGSQG
jgi:hypothetical protein